MRAIQDRTNQIKSPFSTRPILITGSHRSGTTWVGKMIAESPQVAYINEPFNIGAAPGVGICDVKFNYWFTHICQANELDFYQKIKNTTEFSYNLFEELKRLRSPRGIRRIFNEYGKFIQYKKLKLRPLIKDPIALFSSEWLASRFDMDVIVLIRHPAAFAGSLKLKNWTFPFSHFLQQPLLMENILYPFEEEIKFYASREKDIIDQASLLWKVFHYVILNYQRKHHDWLFIRHEDISLKPLSNFQLLFEHLNLDFSASIQKVIEQHTSEGNTVPENKLPIHCLKRNSRENIYTWKNRLTPEEIKRIKLQVKDISQFFYLEEEW